MVLATTADVMKGTAYTVFATGYATPGEMPSLGALIVEDRTNPLFA
jgi:hypothetical protein